MAQLNAENARFLTVTHSDAHHETTASRKLSADSPIASSEVIVHEAIRDATTSVDIDRQMWLLEMQNLREELDVERRARTALERRLAREIALTEKRIKGHLCYRLGREIVACRHSPLAWAVLPRQLLRAYSGFRRDAREKAELRVKPASPALLKLYSTEGAEGVVEQLRRAEGALMPAGLARELVRAGQRLAQAGIGGAELALTAEAIKLDPSPATLRARFWACHRAADFTAAQDRKSTRLH